MDFYQENGDKFTREATLEFKESANVDKERQEIGHPHCVVPVEEGNSQDYFLVDLGADRIYLVRAKGSKNSTKKHLSVEF